MALYYDLPVYRDTYELALKIFAATQHFTREYKYTLGQDMKRDVIELVRCIYRANKLRDISEGFDETDGDALFLDLPNPHDFIPKVRQAIKPGGFFGCILPTVNQVERLLPVLHNNWFAFTEVCELMLRHYKPNYDRLRPTDRMVAHTGYLIFARPMIPQQDTVFEPIPYDEESDL